MIWKSLRISKDNFELEPKNWILILKDFNIFGILFNPNGKYFLIYTYVLKLIESKINGDINFTISML